MLSEEDKKRILDVYNDPAKGLSLQKTFSHLKSQYSLKQVKEALQSQESVQTSKKTNLKNRFLKITTDELGQFQCDLMFLDAKYKKFNSGMNVFLVIIHVMSRYLYVYPMNSKKSENITKALEQFITDAKKYPPTTIVTDYGSEFTNRTTKAFLSKHDIRLLTVNKSENDNSHATAIVERVIRTLREMIDKYLSVYKTNKYIDILPNLIANYNTSSHRSLGKPPADMNDEDIQDLNNEISEINKDVYQKINKIKPGQKVRLLIKKKSLEKGNKFSWSKQVFEIEKIEGNHFVISGKKRNYFFHEIQLVNDFDEKPATNASEELTKEAKRNKINRKLRREGIDVQI